MAENIFFYFFSTLAIVTAVMVIAGRQPVHSVLYLVITMFSLASLFALLGAHFLAVIQILIYAGAVLVLFLFVIMMLDLGKEESSMRQTAGLRVLGSVTAIAFVGEVIFVLKTLTLTLTPTLSLAGRGGAGDGNIQRIGRVLFSQHLLAFELTSFLMLAAIIGAVVLSKKTWSR